MKKRGQRSAIIAVLLLGLLIFGGVYFAWTTATDIFQPVSTDQGKTIAVVVQNGDSTLQIADELLDRFGFELGVAGDRLIDISHISPVMFVVMDFHRLRVNVRFERIFRIR